MLAVLTPKTIMLIKRGYERGMRLACCVLLVLVVSAGPARADTVGGVTGGVYPSAPALGPDGAGLVGVEADRTDYSNGVSCETLPQSDGWVSARAADGSLAPLKALGGDLLAGPARLGDGTFAALTSTSTALSGECTPLRRVELVTLSAAGDVAARTPLADGLAVDDSAVVAGAGGGLAAAWVEVDEPADTETLKITVNGGPPATIATGEGVEEGAISDFALLAEPGGGYLLAWSVPKRVRAVSIAATGTVGAPVTIGEADSFSTVRAGVAANGRAVIAWSTQDGGEERNRSLIVRAAIRARAGEAFAHAHLLRRGDTIDYVVGGFSLAVSPQGRAVLAWADVNGRHYGLYTSVATPRGGFGRVRRDATLGIDVTPGEIETTAFTPTGTALVAYYSHGRSRIARRTPHAKRFAPAKIFTTGDLFALTPGADGHLLAVWTTYPRRDHGLVHVEPLHGG
jgi:hypothetical protein